MIRRLAYVSRPRPDLSRAEIPRIIATGRARNEAAGITGVLLFTGLEFVQLMEGFPKDVADLWASIRADTRHHDLAVFLDERTPARWFSDWRVGFPSDPVILAKIESWRSYSGTPNEDQRSEIRRLLSTVEAI